ncbi:hypothetical protein O2K51_02450 [Apibacter raozihei]|uniref:hypothetical protein n=1 Tax=Apibacter raozihei TaxID=2500547 RepID=UPI000FE3A6A0|nr:hypothetical protein [Apibacter raozihei]
MKKKLLYFVLFVVWQSCTKNTEVKSAKIVHSIMIKYEDSTFNKPIDSLYIKETDTVFYNKKFLLQGYFKIFEAEKQLYSQGELDKGRKLGEWLAFQKQSESGQWKLIRKSSYNKLGYLQGNLIYYNINTDKPAEIHKYEQDEEKGKQQIFYPSGKLHIEYEKDGWNNFINTYIVYTEQGKELYKVDLGNNGNGYIKFYNDTNKLEWEGGFVNKKKEGWHKKYSSDNDKSILVERLLYKNDDYTSRTIIFLPNEEIDVPGQKADSVTYKSFANNIFEVIYYHNGNVIKKEKTEG